MFLDNEDFQKARNSYWRYCERNGYGFTIPSQGASYLDGGKVVLTTGNCEEVIATFNLTHSRLYVRK